MSDIDKHKGELRDYLVTKICYAMNDWTKDCDPSYLAGKYADKILATFEQTISTAVREARIDELEHIISGSEHSDDDFDWYELTKKEYVGTKYYSEVRHLDKDSRIAQLKEGSTRMTDELEKPKAWTKEQYDLMQEHAHEMGYHLITPYRKNLVNIKVGVIRKPEETEAEL
jgi:hypothetical protein